MDMQVYFNFMHQQTTCKENHATRANEGANEIVTFVIHSHGTGISFQHKSFSLRVMFQRPFNAYLYR